MTVLELLDLLEKLDPDGAGATEVLRSDCSGRVSSIAADEWVFVRDSSGGRLILGTSQPQ